MIIGVSGVAGAGKDLFVETCIQELANLGKTGVRLALATALKEEVKDWCLEHYRIDPTNCSREDKEKIRDFLVAHGTTKRHASEGRHWVEKLQPQIESIKDNYDYEDKGFYTDMKNIKEAYQIAKTLVEANVGEVNE